jgi:hypothetical protein
MRSAPLLSQIHQLPVGLVVPEAGVVPEAAVVPAVEVEPAAAAAAGFVIFVMPPSGSVEPLSRTNPAPLVFTETEVTVPLTGLLLLSVPVTALPISAEAAPIWLCCTKLVRLVCNCVDDSNCPIWLICVSNCPLSVGLSGSWFCNCVTMMFTKSDALRFSDELVDDVDPPVDVVVGNCVPVTVFVVMPFLSATQ